jgi:hypothetical protein
MVFLVELEKKDKEYINLMNSDWFYNSNKQNILWVNKIINPKNKKKYNNYKSSLLTKTEIKNVYHGTTKNSFNNILQNGFINGYNKKSFYGVGSYFAKHPDFSYNNYSKDDVEQNRYLIVADICYEKIKAGSINECAIDKNICFTDYILFPGIYVIPNDDAILLKYLICFNSNLVSAI